MIIQPDKWEELQHYKDRKPIWIKLHLKLLDNYKYHMLPIASKAIAPLLWLIASEYQDARIDASAEELAFRLRMPVVDLVSALQPLFLSGFFVCYQDDIVPLAECYHDACLEKRREETETYKPEKEKEHVTDKRRASDAVPPYHELLDAYNKFCPSLSRATELTTSRKNSIRLRWGKYANHVTGPLAIFDSLFKKAEGSDFITGRDGKWKGKRGIDWLLNEQNMVKVLEGNYDNIGRNLIGSASQTGRLEEVLPPGHILQTDGSVKQDFACGFPDRSAEW